MCSAFVDDGSDMISTSIWLVKAISSSSLSFHCSRRVVRHFVFLSLSMDFNLFDDGDGLPPLVDSLTNVPIIIYLGRTIAMPSECTTNPLQRALADSIIRMVSLDELRILFACGAKVSCPSTIAIVC